MAVSTKLQDESVGNSELCNAVTSARNGSASAEPAEPAVGVLELCSVWELCVAAAAAAVVVVVVRTCILCICILFLVDELTVS